MEEKFKESFKQAAAFQKMWMDSMSGMTKVWSEYSPKNPPPEELKKVRNGVLKAVSQTWEEYMRTPEFMQAMKETMNNANQWQKWTKESAGKMQSAMGGTTKDDIQGVMVAVQHVERRVLDCLDDMQAKMAGIQAGIDGARTANAKAVEKCQREILKKLAEVEKNMKARATKGTSQKSAASPKTPAKKAPAKKATGKTTKPKTSKAKQ